MGILKQISKPKFQTLKETQKTKLKHEISKTTKTKPKHTNQHTSPKKSWNTKPPRHWYLHNTHTNAELFRLERTAGGRSLKEQMDRILLREDTAMQNNMMIFNHLIACSCAVKHKIHLHCTNTDIQDSCTLPHVLWKREWGWDEPLVVRNSHVENSGEHVREE